MGEIIKFPQNHISLKYHHVLQDLIYVNSCRKDYVSHCFELENLVKFKKLCLCARILNTST